jgi:hypothetical protein
MEKGGIGRETDPELSRMMRPSIPMVWSEVKEWGCDANRGRSFLVIIGFNATSGNLGWCRKYKEGCWNSIL